MGYKTTDKEYYSAVAAVIKAVMYLCLVALVLVVVTALTIYKNDITSENFRFLLKNLDFNTASVSSGESMQISFRAGGDAIGTYLRGDMALLSRSGYETYDFGGDRIISSSHSFSNPAMKTSQRYALVYDVSGTELDIYNAFSKVYDGNFPYGVLGADINDDGSFAVITSESTYKSGVVVYNSSFSEIFRWMSPNLVVTSVDLPGNKDKILAAGVKAESGEFVTEIYCFDTSKKQPLFNFTLKDEFPLSVQFTDKGFYLLSDYVLTFFDKNGVQLSRHTFTKGTLSKHFNFGEAVAVAVSEGIADRETLKIFSADGKEGKGVTITDGILDVSKFGSTVYLLEPGVLHLMNLTTKDGLPALEYKNLPTISVDKLVTNVFASGTNEYVLMSSNGAGKYK